MAKGYRHLKEFTPGILNSVYDFTLTSGHRFFPAFAMPSPIAVCRSGAITERRRTPYEVCYFILGGRRVREARSEFPQRLAIMGLDDL